jgi:hypothetical protein
MKTRSYIAAMLCPALLLSGCGNLGDDSFAHAIKSGNARMAVSGIQPGQARMHIYESNGKWYYPIHYSIVRGDSATTFALIRAGSPTRLEGRSLAYTAARVNQVGLASQLAQAGFGERQEINDALAASRNQRARNRNDSALAAAGVVGLMMLMGGSGSGGDEGESDEEYYRKGRNAAYEWGQQ